MGIIKDIAAQIDLCNAISVMAYIQSFIAIFLVYQDRNKNNHSLIADISQNESNMAIFEFNQRDTIRYLSVILQIMRNKAKEEGDVEIARLIEKMYTDTLSDMKKHKDDLGKIRRKLKSLEEAINEVHRKKMRVVFSLFAISWIMLILIPLATYLLA